MTENRQLMAKNPRLCTKAYTAFGFSLFLTDFMPFFEEEGHLTSNLFACVPVPTKIRKDTKDCKLSHQVLPVCAQKRGTVHGAYKFLLFAAFRLILKKGKGN